MKSTNHLGCGKEYKERNINGIDVDLICIGGKYLCPSCQEKDNICKNCGKTKKEHTPMMKFCDEYNHDFGIFEPQELTKSCLQFGELDNVKGQTVKGANHISPTSNPLTASWIKTRKEFHEEVENGFNDNEEEMNEQFIPLSRINSIQEKAEEGCGKGFYSNRGRAIEGQCGYDERYCDKCQAIIATCKQAKGDKNG